MKQEIKLRVGVRGKRRQLIINMRCIDGKSLPRVGPETKTLSMHILVYPSEMLLISSILLINFDLAYCTATVQRIHFRSCPRQYVPTQGYHYNDVIMGGLASQITILTTVYWSVYSDADIRKHQSSASLTFVRGIHRWPVNFRINGQ